jgi:hypothetical protein
MLCSSHVSYPPVSSKQNYISTTSRLLPFACCFELGLRVVGMLRLFQVVLSYRVVGKFIMLYLIYEMDMNWRLVGY